MGASGMNAVRKAKRRRHAKTRKRKAEAVAAAATERSAQPTRAPAAKR